ncbi:hypothetical protein [Paenibacillus polymyxa]|nr:hypothetical protein [Paenibacillus polymyxa]
MTLYSRIGPGGSSVRKKRLTGKQIPRIHLHWLTALGQLASEAS